MRSLGVAAFIALALAIGALVIAPEAAAHGGACGCLCIDVNGEAGISGHTQEGSTDVSACRTAAGQACLDNGCYVVKHNHSSCGGASAGH